ncbi:MAG: porin [Gammaproteobacteria bacterium]|nr:porin [Gammaproteobacteria bacterium]
MKKTLATAILVALGCVSAASQAEVRFNGFASIVAGTTMDEDQSLFGYSDGISFKPESLFALQASSDLSEGLTATAQLMARGENDFNAEFEWAYLTYELSHSAQISAGRMRIPFYRYSDFLDVGYAYNWVRPPQSVYRMVFSTYDGISALYNHSIGYWDSSIQVVYGAYEGDINLLSNNDPSELSGITGVNWTVGNDWLTARAVYMMAETSISFENDPDPAQTLNQGIALFGATFPAAASGLEVKEDDGTFFGLGVTMDLGDFIIDSEITSVEVDDSIVATQEQFYISVGYRLDGMVIYGVYESSEDKNDDNYSADLPAYVNHPVLGDVFPQATYRALLMSQDQEVTEYSLGAKFDFHPAANFKVEYSIRETTNFDVNTMAMVDQDDRNVLSAGINVVF